MKPNGGSTVDLGINNLPFATTVLRRVAAMQASGKAILTVEHRPIAVVVGCDLASWLTVEGVLLMELGFDGKQVECERGPMLQIKF